MADKAGLPVPPPKASKNRVYNPNWLESFFKYFQIGISTILGLGALLTASGFIIVNTYLSQFTQIFGYNIVPTQYLTAGISFYLCVFLFIVVVLIAAMIFALVAIFIPSVIYYSIIRKIDIKFKVPVIFHILNRIIDKLSVPIALATLIPGSILWGASVYPKLPRYLGGGAPTPIIVILKDGISPTLYNIESDRRNSQRTATVLLLAELTDGILVQQTTEYIDGITKEVLLHNWSAVIIKNDEIIGILDVSSSQEPFDNPSDRLFSDYAKATVQANYELTATRRAPTLAAQLQSTVDAEVTAIYETSTADFATIESLNGTLNAENAMTQTQIATLQPSQTPTPDSTPTDAFTPSRTPTASPSP